MKYVWLVLTAALFVLGAGVASADPPSPSSPAGRDIGIYGVVPTVGQAHNGAKGGGGGSNLTYHGGKVLRSNRTVAIYWQPSGWTMATGYSSTINQYFTDVAAASGRTDNVYAVETQYYDGTGSIAYSSSFGGSVVDTNPYPASGCSDTVSQTSN